MSTHVLTAAVPQAHACANHSSTVSTCVFWPQEPHDHTRRLQQYQEHMCVSRSITRSTRVLSRQPHEHTRAGCCRSVPHAPGPLPHPGRPPRAGRAPAASSAFLGSAGALPGLGASPAALRQTPPHPALATPAGGKLRPGTHRAPRGSPPAPPPMGLPGGHVPPVPMWVLRQHRVCPPALGGGWG